MSKGFLKACSVLVLCFMTAAILFSGCTKAADSGKEDKESSQTTTAQPTTVQPTEETKPTIDISKEVTVTMYALGEFPAEFPDVLDEINKKLKADVNAQLKVNTLSWGDWNTKYPLVVASGEQFDLIYTADWCFFVDQAQKGGYMALDDLLPQYAPKLLEALPEDAIKQSMINGKMYMVPTLLVSVLDSGYFVRGDLREKYNIPEIKTLDDFGAYLEVVAKNEKGLIPYNAGTNDTGLLAAVLCFTNDWSYTGFRGGVFSKLQEPENVFAWYFTDEYKEFAKKMKTWADKGFWSRNVLSNKMTAKDAMISGKGAAAITNLTETNEAYRQIVKDHPEWKPEWFPIAPETVAQNASYRGDAMAVGANSQNPGRALMVLELLKHNEEYFDLIYYGIKGKHYDLNSEGRLIPTAENVSYSGEDISVWVLQIRNSSNTLQT